MIKTPKVVYMIYDTETGEIVQKRHWLQKSLAEREYPRNDGFELVSVEYDSLDSQDREEVMWQKENQMIDDGIYRRMSEDVFGGDPTCHHIARADFDGNGRCVKCGAWESN